MKKLNYTTKEGAALVKAARKKVQGILDEGLDTILNNPLAETSDYLHAKAVEQGQINVFLTSLELHKSLKSLCGMEYTVAALNVLPVNETELAKIRHDKYADINNDLVLEILVNMALELLTEDEVLDVLLNV